MRNRGVWILLVSVALAPMATLGVPALRGWLTAPRPVHWPICLRLWVCEDVYRQRGRVRLELNLELDRVES